MRRALRYFRPGPMVAIAGVLLLAGIAVLYGIAAVHAAHDYRTLRHRFCSHLVETYNLRNPRIRLMVLADPCRTWEEISGEVIR